MESTIKVIAKAFDIIEILNQSEKLTLKEITQAVNLPKPTVYRILNTLQSIGYVEQTMQHHTLSYKFVVLAKNYLSKTGIVNIAIPYMRKLLEGVGETVNLAKLVDNGAVYLRIEESKHPFRFVDQIGDKASLHSTAIGKSIAAFLPKQKLNELFENYDFYAFTKNTITDFKSLKDSLVKVREKGYAIDDEEGHEGVLCIGTPIFNRENFPFAALSISIPKVRIKKSILNKIIDELPKIGVQISFDLGVTDIRKCFEVDQDSSNLEIAHLAKSEII